MHLADLRIDPMSALSMSVRARRKREQNGANDGPCLKQTHALITTHSRKLS
eukprot:CAMPEP_0182536144 /NCGR_PEP_ID=MMETSP1323-20130603/19426_1 /TAXON_ID=236787 /ORGANISM="Florenciella parvula, Strain RCC1693" /LENGTH=50 /DNA_ID=CAMNT_0024746349 /DNA_START=86 /DNA_END=235 /DNA_ORIENTATION=-